MRVSAGDVPAVMAYAWRTIRLTLRRLRGEHEEAGNVAKKHAHLDRRHGSWVMQSVQRRP